MPIHYWAANGTGTGRKAIQLEGVPAHAELIRYATRAPAIAGATTIALHFFTRVSNNANLPLGWIARPGDVDPATLDQLNLATSKTGISLTGSATATSDATWPNNRIICQGELWLIVDVTVAAGTWSLVGAVNTTDLSLM